MKAVRHLLREVKEINLKGVFEDQVQFEFPSDNHLFVRAVVTPNYGLFQHAKVTFDFTFTEKYPEEKPVVKCMTKVYHPNIAYDGRICFNILSSDWQSGLTLEQLTNALLWLLNNPNFSSALNTVDSSNRYPNLVKQSMMGKKIGNITFVPYLTVDPKTFLLEELKQKLFISYFQKFFARRIIDHIAVAPSAGRGRRNRAELTAAATTAGAEVPLGRLLPANYIDKFIEQVSNLNIEIQPSPQIDTSVRIQAYLVDVAGEAVVILLQGKLTLDPVRLARALNLPETTTYTSLHAKTMLMTGFDSNHLPVHGLQDINGNPFRLIVNDRLLKSNQNTALLLPAGLPDFSLVIPPGRMKELLPPFISADLTSRTKIRVHYVTKFGQNLFLAGDKPMFGQFSPSQALKMTLEDDFYWSVEFDNVVEMRNLSFRFLVKDDFDPSYLRAESMRRDVEIRLNRDNLLSCTWDHS